MEDTRIIELYWQRNQLAIEATAQKYGFLCQSIAYNILGNAQDAEECVADSFFTLWARIPPERPQYLKAYLATITRRLSLTRLRDQGAQKRGGGEIPLALEELGDISASADSVEGQLEASELSRAIHHFLEKQEAEVRITFMARYWLMLPISEIAGKMQRKESWVKVTLYRTRQKLQKYLMKEGLL